MVMDEQVKRWMAWTELKALSVLEELKVEGYVVEAIPRQSAHAMSLSAARSLQKAHVLPNS